ncbi:MAG TPA: YggS family pyridoxal phosphate-dependent enzyme [Patescibacteria group bacterium]|nr:YggS family pyridoxal phosphate-dependent enzyme [Patescibacteria group bacterium]
MTIAENLQKVRQNITEAVYNRRGQAFATGDEVKLIVVTKTQSVERIREAVAENIVAVGENRIQEAVQKKPQLNPELEWHLIGHLQTNKARQAVTLFDLIHSVDSERLALELNLQAAKICKRQNVLLQVNVASEDSKYGIPPRQDIIHALAKLISSQEHLHLCGLMTIAPYLEDPKDLRPVFRGLYNIFGELQALRLPNTTIQWLSMGMTNDYMVAVEEGANMIRVGTGIFGMR